MLQRGPPGLVATCMHVCVCVCVCLQVRWKRAKGQGKFPVALDGSRLTSAAPTTVNSPGPGSVRDGFEP